MPVSAPRPCRHYGCGALVSDGSGYCEKHQADRKVGKFADERRGSRHKRGYGYKWSKEREETFKRDKGLCQPCLKAGRITPATQVDHIVPKAEGGTDDPDNRQSICDDCHKAKTQEEAARARKGRGG